MYTKEQQTKKKKRNKYGAKKQTYGGYSYDSTKEANYARDLDWRMKTNPPEVISWDRQHRFDIRVNGVFICSYKIDFRVVLASGEIEYVEIKGFETRDWNLKWKLTQATFSELTEGENAFLVLNSKRVKTS